VAVAVAVVLGSLGGKPTVEVALEDPTGLEEGASAIETGEAVVGSKGQSRGIIFALEAAVVHEANLIARWDGREWHPLGEGLGPQGLTHMDGLRHSVYFSHCYPRLLAGGEGGLFVRGNFIQAGSVAVQGLARWDGSAWTNPIQEFQD
jgi:hypothetical protein